MFTINIRSSHSFHLFQFLKLCELILVVSDFNTNMGCKVSALSTNINHNVQLIKNGLPRMPISIRRILSNSSILLLNEGKKTKTFTLLNCFAVLASSDTYYSIFDVPLRTHHDIVVNLFHSKHKVEPTYT